MDSESISDLCGRGDQVTALGAFGDEFALENVLRLLGEQLPPFTAKWARQPKRFLGLQVRAGIAEFQLHSVFPNGRIGLAYCPCGDVDCGVLSARVEIEEDTVTWRDVGIQTTYEDFPGWQNDGNELRTFVFERQQYEAVLRKALTLTSLPSSRADHQGR